MFFSPYNLSQLTPSVAEPDDNGMYYSHSSGSGAHLSPHPSDASYMMGGPSLYSSTSPYMGAGMQHGPVHGHSRVTSPFESTTLSKHSLHSHAAPSFSLADDVPLNKRTKKDSAFQGSRVSGACTRCKRLKVCHSFGE